MSLEQELQQAQVIHLDLSRFTAVEIGTSVKHTIEMMRTENHNCAIVTDQGVLVGVFTDHDILVKVVDNPETWNLPVDDFSTRSPLTVKAKDPVDKALVLMEKKQFRNVPVVDDEGTVIGNLTHHAIIEYLANRFPESGYNLPPNPEQNPRKRNGA